jgi:hypothetical protein
MSNSRKHFGRLVGLILALIGLPWPTVGQNNPLTNPTWSSSGPGVPTYSLAIDPSNPNTVYAGGAGNILKSNDGGTTWQSLPLAGDATIALAIDKTNPHTVYAGIAFTNYCHHSFRRLFKSVNGGASWSDSSPPINGCDHINALVLHPSNSNTMYVANFDDFGDTWTPLIKTTDAGATWNALYGPPFAALAIDPHHANTIYAGTFDFTYFGYDGFDSRNGVIKSTNGGVSWNTTGLTNTAVEALVVDPVNPSQPRPGRARPLFPNTLREILIEIPDFRNSPDPTNPEQLAISQFNRAFVLLQYFVYLRRDPDLAGYDFWLNILNNAEPNNYRAMVCAFLLQQNTNEGSARP